MNWHAAYTAIYASVALLITKLGFPVPQDYFYVIAMGAMVMGYVLGEQILSKGSWLRTLSALISFAVLMFSSINYNHAVSEEGAGFQQELILLALFSAIFCSLAVILALAGFRLMQRSEA